MGISTCPRTIRHRDRGAALLVVMLTLVALLGLGSMTILSVQSELSSSGASKFSETALFAAESGASAAMEYLRSNCSTVDQFSSWVNPNNTDPQMPAGIPGNNVQPGGAGNPFLSTTMAWYQVYVLNNASDTGLAAGDDTDSTITLRINGYGPNQTRALLEVTVTSPTCASAPSSDYAQQGVTSFNNANAAGSARMDSAGIRTVAVGGP